MLSLEILDKGEVAKAQKTVMINHYLHRPVDSRCSVAGYQVELRGVGVVGYLLFGRPEATRCGDWYGSVKDVLTGKCEVTRWQVLNLARVYLFNTVQTGGCLIPLASCQASMTGKAIFAPPWQAKC